MIIVRPMVEGDAPQVSQLILNLFPKSQGEFGIRDRIWVAAQTDRIVGFARFSHKEDKLVLNGVGTIPEMREQGVGTMLLERALEEMQQETRPIYLKVKALNPAVNLYARFGFMLKKFGRTYVLVRKART